VKSFLRFAILLGLAVPGFAAVPSVPEIDGNSAVSAVALIAGGILVLRARRK
jgi:hypothetical protein